jgi:hypothetical protein
MYLAVFYLRSTCVGSRLQNAVKTQKEELYEGPSLPLLQGLDRQTPCSIDTISLGRR